MFCSTPKKVRVLREKAFKINSLLKKEPACKPGSVVDSHSSGICVTTYLMRPTRIQCGSHQRIPIWSCSERGLPSPQTVASCAVRSYRTFSPLPVIRRLLRRFTFCCTFRRFTPPRRYLALYPMEPGLSSIMRPLKHK